LHRLNVQFTQIEECIRLSLFAVDMLPKNPPLQVGEELLLQLVKEDAARLGKLDSRVEFALVFHHAEKDPTGEVSRRHWPNAPKTWRYILHGSETVPMIPLSLEKLGLRKDYGGQTNPYYIEPQDAARIQPYLKGKAQPTELPELAGVSGLLSAIRNYDTVIRLAPIRTSRVQEHERRLSDPWLGDALKLLYEHRCQVCVYDFKPRYGEPYADTRFIDPLERGGEPVSRNVLVLCPNHNAITRVTNASFDRQLFAWRYPNGLVEELTLRDHLLS
jgi:hypothetical protein